MSKPILNPNLEGFFENPDYRYYVLHGGRASGKTYHTAGFCVYLAATYTVKFLCVRQFQNRLSDSVMSTIVECIDLAGLEEEFVVLANEIRHKTTGSTFTFLGINRNLNEIKGMTGVEVLWIEEAEGLTEEQWRVIMPTIRAENSKIFIVFNPRLATDFVYKKFVVNPPTDCLVRQVNYPDNPYLSSTMLKVIMDAKENDDDFDHVYLGQPKDDDESAIIKRSHVMAAIDGHIKLDIEPTGTRRLGFDVADAGEDDCAMVEAYGSVNFWADIWHSKDDQLLKSCTRVWNRARLEDSLIVYDAIGVGATSGAKFNELNHGSKLKIEHQKFFAGGKVAKPESQYNRSGIKNKDYFANIKAQAWYLIADRFRNTFNAVNNGQEFDDDQMIFIDSNMPYLNILIDELCTPLQDYDNNGRIKVESKKDLAKRGISSPNIADAFVMANLSSDMRKRSFFG